MISSFKLLIAVAGSLQLLIGGYAPANAGIVEETFDLPVEVTDVNRRTVRHAIKVIVFRDDTRGKAPFLILNHGRSGQRERNANLQATPYSDNARYFVSKGFVVFLPLRVGYGATGGPDVEYSGGCETKNYPPGYEAAAVQTTSLIEHAKTLAYVDRERGLVVGQSFGGATAIAVASKNVPGVMAAVNFAGGGGGSPNTRPERPCREDLISGLFSSYGATARIPTLWLYSENDKYWGKAAPRVWFEGFVARGGNGRFIQLPPYKTDGHPSFTGNPTAWRPVLEEWLRSCCRFEASPAVARATETSLSDRPDAFTQALAAWTAKYNIAQAVVVVRRNGQVVHRGAIGGADPDAAYHLASLSKAITGACVATLVRDGRLSFETPLAQALATFFRTNGRPADPRIGQATIAQLLTHRAGFGSADNGGDPATGRNLRSYLTDHSTRAPPAPAYLKRVFGVPLVRDPGQEFGYSNAGYLVLGAVIEEATGRSYEDYCRDAVLKPAGAAGELEPAWRVMGSYGGWRMNGADYLAFLEQLDPAGTRLGAKTRDWMLDQTGKNYGKTSYPVWYGPGIRLRDTGSGIEIWHTGSWQRKMPPDAQGPRSADTSTFAIRIADGTSWFVHATPLVGGARMELDRELLRAYRSVQTWK